MKITFFIGSLTGGGAEHVICEVATYMSEHGHQSEILTVTETDHHYPIGKDVVIKTLDVKHHNVPSKFRVVMKMMKLLVYVLTNRTDLYVVFLPETIRAIMLFKPFIKAPIIVSERSNPDTYSKKDRKHMLKAFTKADGTIFQTEDAKKYYINNGAKVGESVIIPNAVNPEFIRSPYKGDKLKRIVGAGRLIESKNFSMLIAAFAQIHTQYPEYEMVIYGEGPLKNELIQYAKELRIDNKVKFPGYVKNLGDELEKSDLFVLSSNYEGMPNALMEAMALGVPCISTDCPSGGPRSLIQNGKNGYLIPIGNVRELVDAMDGLLCSKDLRNRIGIASKEVCNSHSYEVVYAQWESFLTKFIKHNNSEM